MNNIFRVACIPVLLAAFACKGNDARKVDDALNNDLSLAAHPSSPVDSLSAAERTGATAASANAYTNNRSQAAPVHHARHSSSSSGTYSSAASGASSRGATGTHVEKHPGRDAAIGAAAGAVLGAATSRNKVKGGIIGAAAGGILGAVIGNNVDKKKVPNQ